jgi:putative membrane protein (TIGR04086 family)
MTLSRLRWGRIVAGGLLAEVALILAIVPVGLRLGDTFLKYAAPPGSFVVCFLGALWACRPIESRFILHGLLVGAVAALFYIALTRFQPEPLAYVIAHALKLAGGAAGGWVSRKTWPSAWRSSVRRPGAARF